ncbi:glycerol-3-phosphate dehydrogenase [Rubrivivax sp. RP6-9]|uniref:glycerol-3-phosphate dehydrogenase n=1 Tax=Rubrivivax sp. RP6-9 TaxID=3415750 RepID=UPI003CC5159A
MSTAPAAPAAPFPAEPPAACDVLVVGGGINGAGIARDLAGRGLSVVLCEKDDLAAHTSSSSTKLIHGGLRYLEYYEFALVRKALAEREVLLKNAPHIMWPLRFVMPHDAAMRPVWMVRAGLFLYDHLARREVLPGSSTVDLRTHPAGAPLKKVFRKGFVYSDGWVDDARLVVLNAIDAAERGAAVLTRCACTDAQRGAQHWQATLRGADGVPRALRARALVNAAGPWAAQFLAEHAHAAERKSLRLVKGSHIVVPRLFEHEHAYIFQNTDKRIIFAIPYEGAYTLIGTTDVEHHGPIGAARIDADETTYLCAQASRYFERPVAPADVVWSYSGVRPLLDDESGDPAAVTRDYALELDTRQAPLLNVWGGKLTTYRKLAEEAADLLAAPLGTTRGTWTAAAPLPGGDLSAWIGAPQRPDTDFERFVQALTRRHPQLPMPLARRLARGYGARVETLLGPIGSLEEMGAEVAPGLYEAELRHLHRHEWARCADDVLWRRTKLGLHYDEGQRAQVAAWCVAHWRDAPAAPAAVAGDREASWT